MKHFWLICFLIIIAYSVSAQHIFVHETPFTNGIIESVYKKDSAEYQFKIFVDDRGEKLTADIFGSVDGEEINKRIIYKGNYKYTFNHDEKLVTKVPVNRDSAEYAPQYFTKTGEDEVMGYKCIVYRTDSMKFWFFEQLLMKFAKGDEVIYYVKFINENAALPKIGRAHV
mgnify:FL=1